MKRNSLYCYDKFLRGLKISKGGGGAEKNVGGLQPPLSNALDKAIYCTAQNRFNIKQKYRLLCRYYTCLFIYVFKQVRCDFCSAWLHVSCVTVDEEDIRVTKYAKNRLLAAVFNNNNKTIQRKNVWWTNREFFVYSITPRFSPSRIKKIFSVSPQKINKLRKKKTHFYGDLIYANRKSLSILLNCSHDLSNQNCA